MCEAGRVNIFYACISIYIYLCEDECMNACLCMFFSACFTCPLSSPLFFLSLLFLLGQHTGTNLAVTKFCILSKVLLLLQLYTTWNAIWSCH